MRPSAGPGGAEVEHPGPEDEEYYRVLLRREQEERRRAEERLHEEQTAAVRERAEQLAEEVQLRQELLVLQKRVDRKERHFVFEKEVVLKSRFEHEVSITQGEKDRMRRQVQGHLLCQRSLMREVAALLPRLRASEERVARELPASGSAAHRRQSEHTAELLSSLEDCEGGSSPRELETGPEDNGGHRCEAESRGRSSAGAQSCSTRSARLTLSRSPRGNRSVPELAKCHSRRSGRLASLPPSAIRPASGSQQLRRSHSGPPITADHCKSLELMLVAEAFQPLALQLPATGADSGSEHSMGDAAEEGIAEEELRAYVRHMQAYARREHLV